MRRAAALPPLACLLLAAAPARAEEAPRLVDTALVAANTAFAVDLYGALAKSPGNAVFSPLSVSTAFAMAREGARGETAAEMDRVLRLPKDAGQGFRGLLDVLNAPRYRTMRVDGAEQRIRTFELAVANGLFGHRGWAIREEFRRTLADAFGAGLETVDFGKPDAARAAINRWVEQKTREKIRDLIPAGQPDPETRLVIANAVYFKAAWLDPFALGATKDGAFHAPGGDVVAPLMRRSGGHAYAETPEVQVLELPYVHGDTSMFVVLPRAKDGLAAVEKALTPAALSGWLSALAHQPVAVTLPRWKHTVSADLGAVMKGLGMTVAFDPAKADFTGIAETPPLFVSSALHKAFIAVDEEGTEAAAATSLAPTASAARPQEPKPFVADHPFLYGIRHRATNVVLFLGRVVDPTR
jgi:serpin B